MQTKVHTTEPRMTFWEYSDTLACERAMELMEDDEAGTLLPLSEYLSRCCNDAERNALRDWYEQGYAPIRELFQDMVVLESECIAATLQPEKQTDKKYSSMIA